MTSELFAFPVGIPNVEHAAVHFGMTLRDYFAAAALSGLCWNLRAIGDKDIVDAAYELADTMLKQREKQHERR